MNESAPGLHRQQMLYWDQMVDLKVAAAYIRHYRDYLGRWVTGVSTIRAIAASSSIALWAVWRDYAFVWASIIAIAQVIDATKEIFTFSKRYKAASEHTIALDRIFIDAQFEWESVYSGALTDEQIMRKIHELRRLQHEAECQTFQNGLPQKKELLARSQSETQLFFENKYGVH